MFDGFVRAVLGFVHHYGFVAVFVYMVLETAFLLHYVPSEVVVPLAAKELVRGPATFVLFVVVTTAGATLGSVLAYLVFGRYGRDVLERYGHVVHVSGERLDWSEAVFVRYGESSVFWGRLLPFLRAFISIPAGFAEMEFRRFVAYSAAGALLFNTGLTYLVYSSAGTNSPLEVVLDGVRAAVAHEAGYVNAHPRVVLVLVGLVVVFAGTVWVARDWIRAHPETAKGLGLHLVRLLGLFVGGLFVLGALSAPENAFAAITSIWDDPRFWVELGFSRQVALLLVGVAIAFAGLAVYELGQLVEVAHLRSALEATLDRMRNP